MDLYRALSQDQRGCVDDQRTCGMPLQSIHALVFLEKTGIRIPYIGTVVACDVFRIYVY